MPQLASGRHIAIGTDSLNGLLEAVMTGFRIHELMSIQAPEHLSPYLDIYYFRPAESNDPAVEYTDAALTPPDGLVPYKSGHTLATLYTGWQQWPAEDRQAFVDFMAEPRFSDYLNSLFAYIEDYKQAIRDNGPFTARVQAHWWDTGIHPLQPDRPHES